MKFRPDSTTLLGILFAVACLLAGQALEGGRVGSIVQATSALIVIGGTLGAVVTQFPKEELTRALRESHRVWIDHEPPIDPLIRRLVDLARASRRNGLLALEAEALRVQEPFLRRALLTLVDGMESQGLRNGLERRIEAEEQQQEPGIRFFDAAGGYAPTIGILGAVIGLIQVMENLADPTKLGSGIAIAFVSTVYGVASANLIFLPLAEKLRARLHADRRRKLLITEGICAIQEGVNPLLLERRLLDLIASDRIPGTNPNREDRPQEWREEHKES